VNPDELFVQLTTLTALSRQEWEDILALPPDAQALVLQAYRDASWKADPDTFGQVLTVLQVVGTIAGVVGGVAGAASAIAALRSL
jgi:hypothetical protein